MIVHDLRRLEQVILKADYLHPFRERAYLEFESHEPRLTIRSVPWRQKKQNSKRHERTT
jgi:hypothetical protein